MTEYGGGWVTQGWVTFEWGGIEQDDRRVGDAGMTLELVIYTGV